MNEITQALMAAGVAMPTSTEQVWRYVKENPGCSAKAAVKALPHIPATSVSSLLGQMEKREMVYSRVDATERHAFNRYYTDDAVYTPRPWPKRGNGKAAPVQAPAPSVPAATVNAVTYEGLYAANLMSLMSAWLRAGGGPEALVTMPVSEMLQSAARNGISLTARTAR